MKLRHILLATAALFAVGPVVSHADDGLRLVAITATRVTAALGYTPVNPAVANTFSALQTFNTGGITTASIDLSPGGFNSTATQGLTNKIRYGIDGYGIGLGNNNNVDYVSGGNHYFWVNGALQTRISAAGIDPVKATSAPSAPGAGFARIFVVAGTNSGTCKVQIMAGTSATPVTIVDNVGAGC